MHSTKTISGRVALVALVLAALRVGVFLASGRSRLHAQAIPGPPPLDLTLLRAGMFDGTVPEFLAGRSAVAVVAGSLLGQAGRERASAGGRLAVEVLPLGLPRRLRNPRAGRKFLPQVAGIVLGELLPVTKVCRRLAEHRARSASRLKPLLRVVRGSRKARRKACGGGGRRRHRLGVLSLGRPRPDRRLVSRSVERVEIRRSHRARRWRLKVPWGGRPGLLFPGGRAGRRSTVFSRTSGRGSRSSGVARCRASASGSW